MRKGDANDNDEDDKRQRKSCISDEAAMYTQLVVMRFKETRTFGDLLLRRRK